MVATRNFQRVMLTGASGVGKSTVASQLVSRAGFTLLRSHTTRAMRPNESADAYHFVSAAAFAATPMVEHMTYQGNSYGLSVAALEAAAAEGDIVHVASCDTFERYHPLGFRSVMLESPDEAELLRRLHERDGHHGRAAIALAEHRNGDEIKERVDAHVTNDALDHAVNEVLGLVDAWRREDSK